MKSWTVKKGNKSVRDILIKDKDDVIVTNLAAATEIKFQIKNKKTDAVPLLEKTKDDGITINTPSEGYLRITLLPTDTKVTLGLGSYFMGLQIKWSATDIYEIKITIDNGEAEFFKVIQDIVQ